jgi:acetyl-CoA synthetase
VERARVTQLARHLGVAEGGIAAVRSLAVEQPARFWAGVVEDLELPFLSPWETVLDASDGVAFPRWFEGATTNACHVCVDRHADDPAVSTRPALVVEDERGRVETLSYVALRDEVARVAAGLESLGVERGERVVLLMPMCAEAAVSLFACARIGAVCVPVLSGLAPPTIAQRLDHSGARVLLTADGYLRRGRRVELGRAALVAAHAAHARVQVVVAALGEANFQLEADHISFAELGAELGGAPLQPLPSEHPLMWCYTSGTTGLPKAAVHVHAGFVVKVTAEMAYQTDARGGESLSWYSDPGWIMGPWLIVGALALGATCVLLRAAVDVPDPGRPWAFAARHRLAWLGVSPSLVRSVMLHGDEHVRRHDLGALRALCSAGEVLDHESYRFLFEVVGGGRLPVLNMSGGTEVGAFLLSSHPVEEIAPGSFGGPALGCDLDVVDADGRSLRGQAGELVCRSPWPSMTRGFARDRGRYLATYWSQHPGAWSHGDLACVDEQRRWFLLGRSDDTLNIAGKRVGPAEYEELLVSHPQVTLACAVGVSDARKGEAAVCYVVPGPDTEPRDALRDELADLVAAELGRSYRPNRILFVADLPRNRTGKLLRRVVRSVARDEDPGDANDLENPGAIEALRRAR